MENFRSRIPCDYCDKTYAFKSGLYRHQAEHHALEIEEVKRNITCESCDSKYVLHNYTLRNNINKFLLLSCTSRFHSVSMLSKHMEEQHQIQITQRTLGFENNDEFSKWKESEEKKCLSHYVQNTAPKTINTVKYLYLYCNRFGSTRLRGQGKRHMKIQGSSKIGKKCIANLRVKENTVTGKVSVDYCSTHTGHSIQLCHLPMGKYKTRIADRRICGSRIKFFVEKKIWIHKN